MTVPLQDPEVAYSGNGVTTVFAFPFLVFDAEDLAVAVDGVVKTLNVDYTLAGLGDSAGGSVTFLIPPAAGVSNVTLQRSVVLQRDTDYQYSGDFQSPTVNRDFDRAVMMAQDTRKVAGRSIQLPIGEVASLILPPVSLRALRGLAFDVAGNAIAALPSDATSLGATLLDSTAPTNGSSLVGFKLNATGAQGRTTAAKLADTVSVKDFGAKGDGVTTDTAAFTAALATGKRVFVPAGTYLTGQVQLPTGAAIYGVGRASIIKPTAGFSTNAFWVTNAAANGVEVGNLQFDLPIATFPNTVPLYAQAGAGNNFHDIYMPAGGNIGILLVDNTDTIVTQCIVETAKTYGIQSTGTSSARNKIDKCRTGPTTISHGIQFIGGKDHQVVNSVSQGAKGFGISFFRTTGGVVDGCRAGESELEAIQVTDSSYVTVSNNRCSWDVGGVSSDFGISVAAQTPGYACIGVKILGNQITGNFASAIALASTNFGADNLAPVPGPGLPVQYCDVSGNTVVNSNKGGGLVSAGRACGVVLYGDACQHNTIQNNVLVNTEGNMKVGVAEANVDSAWGFPSQNRVLNNKVTGASVIAIDKTGNSTEALSSGLRTWTPTVTSASGALTSTTINYAYFYEIEKRVDFAVSILINTNGTGAGAIDFTLPRTALFGSGTGRETVVGGKQLAVSCTGASARIRNYDNSYPASNTAVLEVAGTFFIA